MMEQLQYTQIPEQEVIDKTAAAFAERNITVFPAANSEEALNKIKALIPPGSAVMNGSSTTLQQIGFVEYLKTGPHGWRNLHEDILSELDPKRQAKLRAESVLSEYFLGGVHAITQEGQLLFASATGSQLPGYAYTAPNVIWVASANKIVPTLEDAFKRVRDYVFPLEDKRMKEAGYAGGSAMNKWLIIEREANPERKLTLILVNQPLGF